MEKSMNVVVLDGNSILNRAFYGVRTLTTKSGQPTNAIFGFLNILDKILGEEAPDGICVAFDMKGPTFRHTQYEGYKAQRKGMPEELASQLPILKEILDAMGVARYELAGFEADDLIGTIAKRSESDGFSVTIVTGDRDDLQLVTEQVRVKFVVTRGGKTESHDYTPARFRAEYGFPPEQLVDLKALMGDSSDNIPGVPGIGEKTGGDLIRRFGTLTSIYENLAELDIKEPVRKKLEAGKDSAFLSHDLATIRCDAPFAFQPADTLRRPMDRERLYRLFLQLEFIRLIEKFGLSPSAAPTPETAPRQSPASVTLEAGADLDALLARFQEADYVSVFFPEGSGVEIGEADRVTLITPMALGDAYDAFIRRLFGGQISKIGHHVKEMLSALLSEGVPGAGFVFDTALAAYLLSPTDNAYGLGKLSVQYLGYQETGAAAVYALYAPLKSALSGNNLETLHDAMELPLCRVLARMEHAGILVDRAALQAFGKTLGSEIQRVEADIYALAGEDFNPASPKQLGEILFDKLMLPAPKKTKTGYSTNIDVLERLRDKHPIIPKIMEYRQYAKLKSTYTDGLAKWIGPDGRIHTRFQMTVTATGRLSSMDPNLQNIPIRTALGGELRKMFVAPAGYVLVDADYSQIELRLLAHISGDETMREAFQNAADIHTVTASQVFGVSTEDVTPLMRSRAKAVNFGIVYGISDFSLAQDIGVSRADARAYMDSYFAKYHGVRDYMARIKNQARADGFVSTLFGRRRALPELASKNHNTRAFGERVALNMPIQGTAADIIKLAMLRVSSRLEREGYEARLVLQVHDELIVEAPLSEAEPVRQLLIQEMAQAASLTVPLTADAKWGETWYAAH